MVDRGIWELEEHGEKEPAGRRRSQGVKTSNIQHPTSNSENRQAGCLPPWEPGRQTSNIQHRTSNIHPSTLNLQLNVPASAAGRWSGRENR
jgi:hypothetical protein